MSKKNLSKKNSSQLSIVVEPAVFFKEQVSEVLSKKRFKPHPNTEFYIVDLLSRFMITENLFTVGSNGEKHQEVLAVLLAESLGSPDIHIKQKHLRRLGDVSLYTAGFFSDSFCRRVVDIDYYIGMGKSAYLNLSRIGIDKFLRSACSELAEHFTEFVDVLAEIGSRSGNQDPKNILRQYELWLKTRSERAEKNLKDAGIIPNKGVKGDWQ